MVELTLTGVAGAVGSVGSSCCVFELKGTTQQEVYVCLFVCLSRLC